MQPVHATGRDQSPRDSISLIVARDRAADAEKCSVIILNLDNPCAPHIPRTGVELPRSNILLCRHTTRAPATTRITIWGACDRRESIRSRCSETRGRAGLSAPIHSQPTRNPPPKHGFLDRSDLPSVRQLPVSWLSTQQAAKCQLSMGTQRRGGASHLPDPPSTPSSRSARKSRR